ncbi:uncharacterized protein [Pagrus major]|uniref:uncharacterized protein n=1 Tax=Pagrus major TaxID=143350 RepID=UPI003CC845C0
MIVFCVTLLLLHQGYALVPVTTVQLGEPVTFTCLLPFQELGSKPLHWYKQSVGDDLRLIVTFMKHTDPVFKPEFSASRLDLKVEKNISKLTILRTTEEDEGMYHCVVIFWTENFWSGTYLSLKGNTQRTSTYTVVQRPTASDPVRPGDLKTLQCSVLSDSETKTCPGDHSVFWFRVGSDESHPNILYTDGNRRDECEDRSDTQKSCVYHFSKNVSSSDAETYYCAVATCGEILFGNGTKLDIEGTRMWSPTADALTYLLCAALAISLVVIAFLIYATKKQESGCYIAAVAGQKIIVGQKSQQRDVDMRLYSVVVFTMMKTDRGAMKHAGAAERERIYTAVKAFGLD